MCKIIDVDLKKLFNLEELTVKVISGQKESEKGTAEVIKIPVKKIKAKSTTRYDAEKVASKEYSVEAVESEVVQGEISEPIKIQEEKMPIKGVSPQRNFVPTAKSEN